MRTPKFLKKNSIILLLGLLFAITSCSFTTKKIDPGDNGKEQVLAELVTYVLENYHYHPKQINDAFSTSVYHEYLKNLDPRKRFFLKSDIEEFSKYEKSIDDQLRDHSVDFFTLTYNRLQKRIQEMEPVYKEIIAKPFDFTKNETINTDYENIAYPATKKERKDRWRKQIKLSVLANYYDLKQGQEAEKKDKAKKGESFTPKTDAALQKEAQKTTLHSLKQFFDLNGDLKRSDWFSIYLNAIAKEFDPHTGYFAPVDKKNFDIEISGSLEGIGARLQKDLDNTKVISLVSGGPAWKDGRLKVGDIIQKVKQEDEDKAVSIVGMPLQDAVQLIRGPKGSKVTLTVKSVDGTIKKIQITRDIIHIEATYAKSAITQVGQKKYGFIRLPSFYFDIKDYNKPNAATDMKKQIDLLKKQHIDGLVIDLRNNGGGSLATAIDIAGMFIKKGPVVQVRAKNGERKVRKDHNPTVEWDGPLVILVNELSASASEILTAAMQDYGRAVIIGSKQTYGKGTVQRFINLDRFMRNDDLGKMGSLKLTTQKFYRINGGATQLKGVHSDVVVPDQYSYIDVGERDMFAPLPWDKISPASYDKWNGYTNFDAVVKQSQERVNASKQFKLINKHAKWVKEQQDKNVFPLNYKKYKADIKKTEKEADRFDSLSEYTTNLVFKSLPQELKEIKADSTLALKRKRWHKSLSKDPYVEEAIHVLKDLKLTPAIQEAMAKAKK